MISFSFSGLNKILILLGSVLNPFPNKKIAARINGIERVHIMRESCADYFVVMHFESDCNISFDRKQIVDKNYVVLATCHQETTVGRKVNVSNIATVTSLVLFYQQ